MLGGIAQQRGNRQALRDSLSPMGSHPRSIRTSDLDRNDERIGRQAPPILPGPFGRSLTALVVLGGGSGASPYIRRIARTRARVAHNRAGNPYTSDNRRSATSATH